ncbi:hypothetical protein GJ496_000998 [Pomphorhynchus laevis]|nr:hypothetical protein GJ496_002595 [Pomphorhynchus laevis]KAI0979828.1 hypothetical protein GJ496_000998 [Pomphorhynchus laevis]
MSSEPRIKRSSRSRVLDRINTNPLVPISVGAAISLLGYNMFVARKNAVNKSWFWCQTRVIVQGSAIAILSLGSIYKLYQHMTEESWPPKMKKED